MRTDLIWFLIKQPYSEPFRISNVIMPEARRELWAAIRALPQTSLNAPIYTTLFSSPEDGWKEREISADGFGNPLCWVSFGDLLSLRDHPDVSQNVVIPAMWKALDDYYANSNPRIVLFWYQLRKNTRGQSLGSRVFPNLDL